MADETQTFEELLWRWRVQLCTTEELNEFRARIKRAGLDEPFREVTLATDGEDAALAEDPHADITARIQNENARAEDGMVGLEMADRVLHWQKQYYKAQGRRGSELRESARRFEGHRMDSHARNVDQLQTIADLTAKNKKLEEKLETTMKLLDEERATYAATLQTVRDEDQRERGRLSARIDTLTYDDLRDSLLAKHREYVELENRSARHASAHRALEKETAALRRDFADTTKQAQEGQHFRGALLGALECPPDTSERFAVSKARERRKLIREHEQLLTRVQKHEAFAIRVRQVLGGNLDSEDDVLRCITDLQATSPLSLAYWPVGTRVEVLGRATHRWHVGTVTSISENQLCITCDEDDEILIRDPRNHDDRQMLRRLGKSGA